MTKSLREKALHTLQTGEIYLTDAEPYAAFIVRVTSPDTHDRIIDIVCDEQWAMDPHGCAAAIFALLTEESR